MFHYFQASKNVRNKRKGSGGSIKVFRRKIFLSQCRKNLQGNSVVQCFRNMPVAKKLLDKGRGGGYQDFPSKNPSLTVPKNFAGESSTA